MIAPDNLGGAYMEPTRTQKLQAIKARWQSEKLDVQFPSLGVEMQNPTTRAEFVLSPRFMTAEEAVNTEHFGVADPKTALATLNTQFETAPTGQVDTKALKDAAVILDVFKRDSDRLAAHFAAGSPKADETLHASYEADAKAATQCSALIAELATELGISLTTKDPKQRG
jgi:hypothetical protein